MNRKFSRLVLLFIMLSLVGCKKDEAISSTESGEMDNFILSLGNPIQSTPGQEQIGDVLKEIDSSTQLYCECRKYKANEEFSELRLLDPTSSVIYPGSIIDAKSVTDGSYRQIVLDRAPMRMSTNLPFFDNDNAVTVEDPSLSNVRSAIKKMIYDSNITGSNVADMTFEIVDVYSEEQLGLAIGCNFKAGEFGAIGTKFDFTNKETNTKLLLKFIQVYYDVSVDAPSSPSKFFKKSVTVDDFKSALGGNNVVPVYVSNVKYGRVAYFAIESSESRDSVYSYTYATVNQGRFSTDDSVRICKNDFSKKIKISGTIIGGSGSDAAKSVSLDGMAGLLGFINNGGKFSKTSPGAPIAYTLTRLSDNSVFNVVSGSEFVARKCTPLEGLIVPSYFYGSEGNDNDVYGTITAQIGYGDDLEGEKIYLFNADRDNRLYVEKGATIGIDSKYYEGDKLNLDYDRLEDAFIEVEAKLMDYDEQCCTRWTANYDDSYNVVKNRFYLKNIDFKKKKSVYYNMENDGTLTMLISSTTEYNSGHKEYRKGKTKHNDKWDDNNLVIKFGFKINVKTLSK